MKINFFSLMKTIKDLVADKDFAARSKEATREPVYGFNESKDARAVYDLNTCRFIKLEAKPDAFEGKDYEEMFKQITIAANDALQKADELWQRLSPDSVKALEAEAEKEG